MFLALLRFPDVLPIQEMSKVVYKGKIPIIFKIFSCLHLRRVLFSHLFHGLGHRTKISLVYAAVKT